jgi:hypothetical protein
LIFRVSAVYSQDAKSLTVRGYILDGTSAETLIDASVYAVLRGTVSNNYGFYSLSLPAGTNMLTISYVGYRMVALRLDITRDTVINVSLESSFNLAEVVVEGASVSSVSRSPVSSTRVGAVHVSPSMIRSVPAILGEVDLIKVLRQMLSVSVGTEGFSGLYVRGGNKDENLYLIDGNPVYDVNHLFGFFSTFNDDAIKRVAFYRGNFPARFGGRLSSVIDVRTKDGNMREYHGAVTVGLVSSKVQLEGPTHKDQASFNIAYRRTYLDLLLKPIFAAANASMEGEKDYVSYYFDDLNGKLNYKFSDRSRLYFNWY